MKTLLNPWFLLGLPLFALHFSANAALFRYTNDQGQTVLDDTMPAEFVHKGYEILDDSGRLVETVPATVVKTEKTPHVNPQEVLEQEANRLRDDVILLTSYSTVEEIEQHRERKRGELEKQISFVALERSNLQKTYNAVQAQAADYERRGQAVPENLLARLTEYEQGLETLGEMQQSYQKQIDDIDYTYGEKISRFISLKESSSRP